MKPIKVLFMFGLALCAAIGQLQGSEIKDDPNEDRIAILFRHLKISHQHAWRNLTINFEYATDSGMAVDSVKTYIKDFLEGYSNPDDFWEVMNTHLVKGISQAFPEIVAIESVFSLAPDEFLIFPRQSLVKYNRGSDTLKEQFSFTKLNYLICQETFRSLELQVAFDLKDNPIPSDYPDYQWIDTAMKTFFDEHPVSLSHWIDLQPILVTYLLEKFPSMIEVSVEVTAAK